MQSIGRHLKALIRVRTLGKQNFQTSTETGRGTK